jgi:TRAP-type mannitol/chloroaromatic compound transport system permease small subunit
VKRFCDFIDRINIGIGKISSFLILILVAIVMYEVVSRYLFNAPTQWTNELSEYLLTGVVMMGGAYCLAEKEHVRVDIIHRNFSDRTQAWIEIFTFFLVLTFVTAIVWKGGEASFDAFIHDRRSMSVMEMPLFPSMVLVPVGAFLLGLQSLAGALRAVLQLTGSQPTAKKDI